jgi:hypothetical protein
MKRSEFIKKTALTMTTLAFSTLHSRANILLNHDDDYDYYFNGRFNNGDGYSNVVIELKGELKKYDLIEMRISVNSNNYIFKYRLLKTFKENKKIGIQYVETLQRARSTEEYVKVEIKDGYILTLIDTIKIKETKAETILYVYDDKKEVIKVEKSKGGCYLTTACTENKGLPDNCYELETLRGFRDNFLLKNKEGIKLVDEYYKNAPAIVSKIQSSQNKDYYLNFIYDNLVVNTISLVIDKKYDLAQEFYAQFTMELNTIFIVQQK